MNIWNTTFDEKSEQHYEITKIWDIFHQYVMCLTTEYINFQINTTSYMIHSIESNIFKMTISLCEVIDNESFSKFIFLINKWQMLNVIKIVFVAKKISYLQQFARSNNCWKCQKILFVSDLWCDRILLFLSIILHLPF